MIKTYGTVFYSSKSIAGNFSHFADSLNYYYKHPSLLPEMKWIDSVPPMAPANLAADVNKSTVLLKWDKPMSASDGDTAYKYVVYRFDYPRQINIDNAWHILKIQGGGETTFVDAAVEKDKLQYTYVVTALDRLNNESKPVVITVRVNGF